MSVTPLGNATFINQNAPVVSQTHASTQARFDLQSALAAQLASENASEVTALRPTEETYKIDPEHQHERQKGEQEASEQEGEPREFAGEDEQTEAGNLDEILENSDGDAQNAALSEHRLDIKI